MPISTYDNRPLSEIRNDLLGEPYPDQLAALIVLCDRIQALEARLERLEVGTVRLR